MIKFNKPENLNGAELLDELTAAGVIVADSPYLDAHGDLYLDIKDSDASKAEKVVAAHNGSVSIKEPSLSDKLATVGLSLEELKAALLA